MTSVASREERRRDRNDNKREDAPCSPLALSKRPAPPDSASTSSWMQVGQEPEKDEGICHSEEEKPPGDDVSINTKYEREERATHESQTRRASHEHVLIQHPHRVSTRTARSNVSAVGEACPAFDCHPEPHGHLVLSVVGRGR